MVTLNLEKNAILNENQRYIAILHFPKWWIKKNDKLIRWENDKEEKRKEERRRIKKKEKGEKGRKGGEREGYNRSKRGPKVNRSN